MNAIRQLPRALLVLAALMGVFVVHGLAAGQDTIVCAPTGAIAVSQGIPPTAGMAEVAESAPLAGGQDPQVMIACLTFLTGSLLLVGIAARRFWRLGRSMPGRAGVALMLARLAGRPSAYLAPSLSELSILRI